MKSLKQIAGMSLGFLTVILLISYIAPDKRSNLTNVKEGSDVPEGNAGQQTALSDTIRSASSNYKVIFIELGSVRCIPCQMMQTVMKSIREKHGDQVNVVFYDVWTPEGKPYGEKYGIEAIPTQVFLDENGKEYYRHLGYFPEEELVKVLKEKGVR